MAIMDDLLRQVTGLKIETKYSPPIFLDKPFEASDDPGLIAQLKPRVTVYTKNYKPFVSQVYGSPEPNQWPTIKAALIMGGVAVAVGLISIGRKL